MTSHGTLARRIAPPLASCSLLLAVAACGVSSPSATNADAGSPPADRASPAGAADAGLLDAALPPPAERECARTGAPKDVSSSEEAPLSLVAEAAHLYWISAAGGTFRVRRASKDGDGEVETLLETTEELGSMALVGGKLVMASKGIAGEVFTVDVGTRKRSRLARSPAALELDAFGVTADDQHAYVVAHDTAAFVEVVLRVPLGGGPAKELGRVSLPFDETVKGAIVDGAHVYWALSAGRIFRLGKAQPGTVETFVNDSAGLSAFAITESDVLYASSAMDTTVFRVPKSGASKKSIVAHTGARFAIAGTTNEVVYATAADELRRVALDGTNDRQITSFGVRSCGSILVDGAEVFFANTATARAGGSVRAVCLSP